MYEKIKRFLKEKKELFLKTRSNEVLFVKRDTKYREKKDKELKSILLKIDMIHKKQRRGEKLNLFEKYYIHGYTDKDLDVYSSINVLR